MMRRLNWAELDPAERVQALARPENLYDPAIDNAVQAIMSDVRTDGDKALRALTLKFDGVDVADLQVDPDSLAAAWDALPVPQQDAIKTAAKNIERFHIAQRPKAISVETMAGVTCQRLPRAIDTVGLYVPGGTAPLVSTVMMLAIPAKVAGVRRAVIMTPPSQDGRVNPAVLAAACYCGITEVYAVGGAQAIAALAYGTETIPKVAKIFGPGNAYVAAAKSIASSAPGGPAIDLPAGPSEAMVLADANADPRFVASDLLSQAEHDTMAQVICVCSNKDMSEAIERELATQLKTLPRRDIAQSALNNGRMIIVQTRTDMIEIVAAYAPEHLIVQVDNPADLVPNIQNAGSVFLGPWTPESVGDYASGTNHTLPTYGAARAYSGVNTESFMTQMTVQTVTQVGLAALGPVVERLADMEGLEAHKRAISLRLESLRS